MMLPMEDLVSSCQQDFDLLQLEYIDSGKTVIYFFVERKTHNLMPYWLHFNIHISYNQGNLGHILLSLNLSVLSQK